MKHSILLLLALTTFTLQTEARVSKECRVFRWKHASTPLSNAQVEMLQSKGYELVEVEDLNGYLDGSKTSQEHDINGYKYEFKRLHRSVEGLAFEGMAKASENADGSPCVGAFGFVDQSGPITHSKSIYKCEKADEAIQNMYNFLIRELPHCNMPVASKAQKIRVTELPKRVTTLR